MGRLFAFIDLNPTRRIMFLALGPVLMAAFLWLAVHRWGLSATPITFWVSLPILAFSVPMTVVRALMVRGAKDFDFADHNKSQRLGVTALFVLYVTLALGGCILLAGFLVSMVMADGVLQIELIRAFGMALVLAVSTRFLIDGIVDANLAIRIWKCR